MSSESMRRVRRLKKLLERIALVSLFLDTCISIATLISLNVGRQYTTSAIYILNYILTAIVILSVIVFAAILLFSRYDRIISRLSLRSRRH
jgi:uncharacterized protein HemY